MEIETPTLKEDLLRYDDNYSRRISGYNITNFITLNSKILNELNIKKINKNKYKINNKLTLKYITINNINEYSLIIKGYNIKSSMILPIVDNKKYKIKKMLYSLSNISINEVKSLISTTNIFLIIGDKKK